MANTPGFIAGIPTPAAVMRTHRNGLLVPTGTNIKVPRQGVLPAGGQCAVTATGGMGISVAAGVVVVDSYTVAIDAAAPLTVSPAAASARTDIVVVRIRDNEELDGADSATLEIIAGTPGGGVPVTPARCTKLADIAVGASVSSISNANITDRRQATVAAGGIIPIPGALSAAPSGLPPGQAVWDSQVGLVGVVNAAGTGWATRLGRPTDQLMAADSPIGSLSIPANASARTVVRTVTVPSAPFARRATAMGWGHISVAGAAGMSVGIRSAGSLTADRQASVTAVGPVSTPGYTYDIASGASLVIDMVAWSSAAFSMNVAASLTGLNVLVTPA